MQYEFCEKLVNNLYLKGCRDVVICPGSRNAPLIQAFSNSGFQIYSQVDERSAGYHALGISKASSLITIVCCSSGTAVANLLPAAIEAHYQNINLLFLTADRPESEALSYANQSISQTHIFEGFVRSKLDILAYDESGKECLNALLESEPCSMHINIRLTDPLYSFKSSNASSVVPNGLIKKVKEHKEIDFNLNKYSRVLVVGGFGAPEIKHESENLLVYSDPCAPKPSLVNLHCLEHFIHELTDELLPELLITTGRNLLSKKLRSQLKEMSLKAHFHFDDNENYISPYQAQIKKVFPSVMLQDFIERIEPQKQYFDQVYKFEISSKEKISELRRVNVVLRAIQSLYDKYKGELVLHAGNSMAVRYMALFSCSLNIPASIIANRGTAGIDGSLSTFIGYCLKSPNEHHLLVIGDLSFIYDFNGFWIEPMPKNMTILIINNKGGFIFDMVNGTKKLSQKAQVLQKTTRELNIQKMVESLNLSFISTLKVDTTAIESQIIELIVNPENEKNELQDFWT